MSELKEIKHVYKLLKALQVSEGEKLRLLDYANVPSVNDFIRNKSLGLSQEDYKKGITDCLTRELDKKLLDY